MEMNLCGACERHVYVDEPSCPFCGSPAPRRPIPRMPSGGRMSRAAAHAVRAAVLVGAVGCYQSHERPTARDPLDAAPRADASAIDASIARDAGTDAGRRDAGRHDARIADGAPPDANVQPPDANVEPPDADIAIYGGVFPDPRQRAVV